MEGSQVNETMRGGYSDQGNETLENKLQRLDTDEIGGIIVSS